MSTPASTFPVDREAFFRRQRNNKRDATVAMSSIMAEVEARFVAVNKSLALGHTGSAAALLHLASDELTAALKALSAAPTTSQAVERFTT